jgi:hypothetical protein
VDADADVALGPHLRLPGVQAHPHLHLHSFRPLVSGEVALGVDRGCHGVGCRAEGDEERVALRIHHAAFVGGQGGLQDARVLGQERVVPIAAHLLEQSSRALDICEEEGDGAAW